MKTADEVELNVKVSSSDSDWTYTTLSGDQGDQWKKLKINIPIEKGYKLKISAHAKSGVVAIDDISYKRGAC